MAKPPTLKVFVTSIGFHDAYVAVPSKKAALEAWGADKDLFAMKAADQVSDPKLMAEPLKAPGTVIRVPKGTTADHLRAAGKSAKTKVPTKAEKAPDVSKPVPTPKPKPRPSRKALERAEQALAQFEEDAAEKQQVLREREEALKREREKLAADIATKRAKLETQVAQAKSVYVEKLAAWEG